MALCNSYCCSRFAFTVEGSDANTHHVDADPNLSFQSDADLEPTFHFAADPDPTFILMRIWIQILLIIQLISISGHWSTDPPRLHFEPPLQASEALHGFILSLHASIASIRGTHGFILSLHASIAASAALHGFI